MGVDRIELGDGYVVLIDYDQSPDNPWSDWDCEPPLMVGEYGGAYGMTWTEYGNAPCVHDLNDVQVRANAKEIANRLGYRSLLALVKDSRLYPDKDVAGVVNEMILWYFDDVHDKDRLDFLQIAYSWAGIETYRATTRGYCQGAQHEVLAIASPEWVAKTGLAPDAVEGQLLATTRLFAAWAYGDVYGARIVLPEGDEDDDDAEEIESCWGFYGDDHEKSGLMRFAEEVKLNHQHPNRWKIEHARPMVDALEGMW